MGKRQDAGYYFSGVGLGWGRLLNYMWPLYEYTIPNGLFVEMMPDTLGTHAEVNAFHCDRAYGRAQRALFGIYTWAPVGVFIVCCGVLAAVYYNYNFFRVTVVSVVPFACAVALYAAPIVGKTEQDGTAVYLNFWYYDEHDTGFGPRYWLVQDACISCEIKPPILYYAAGILLAVYVALYPLIVNTVASFVVGVTTCVVCVVATTQLNSTVMIQPAFYSLIAVILTVETLQVVRTRGPEFTYKALDMFL